MTKLMIRRPLFLMTAITVIFLQIPTVHSQQARRTASYRSSKPSQTRQEQSHRQHQRDRRHEEEKERNDFYRRNRKHKSSQQRHRRDQQDQESSSFWTEEETSTAIAKIMRKTKPRGLIHGIWKASQSTTLGFLIGMTCLGTFPLASVMLVGFQMKPMLLATAIGSITGLLSVSIGIWNGLYHCYWGLVQWPKSIQSWWKGSVWNPYDGGSWQVYNLKEHQQQLASEVNSNDGNAQNYYQILEVPATASKSEIKRAYYVKAKELHPDKNSGEKEDVEEAFLQLQKAYDTLSDEAQRSWYDELGQGSSPSSVHDKIPFHPNLFFSILLDSNALQPLVGNLAVSSWTLQLIQLGLFNENDGDRDPHENVQSLIVMVADLQRKEQKRQVDVAMNLLGLIQDFPSSEQDWSDLAFRQYCRQQALAMVDKSFFQDVHLLQLVGERLELSARQWEGRGRPFGLAKRGWLWTKSSIGLVTHRLEFYKGIFGLLQYLLKYMDAIRQGDFSFMEGQASGGEKKVILDETTAKEATEELVPKLWHLLWHYTTLDVQATIDGASWKLFSDSGADRMEQWKRARALRIMGQEFIKVAKETSSGGIADKGEIATEHDDDDDDESLSYSLIPEPAIRLEVAMAVAKDQASDNNPIKLRKKVHQYLKQREDKESKKKSSKKG